MTENADRGFQKIGAPMKKILNSLAISASTPAIPPTGSEITGLPTPEPPASSSTGQQHGGTGVAVKPTESSVALTVRQKDRLLLASWPEPLRTSLISRAIYDSDFSGLIGYDPIEPRADEGRAMMAEALAALDDLLVPASPDVVYKALARVAISTCHRSEDGPDAKFQRAIYAQELREFPADVVVEACRNWSRREKWWPAVAEILAECQKLVRWRRRTRDALRAPFYPLPESPGCG
jgi:hypothetical protein